MNKKLLALAISAATSSAAIAAGDFGMNVQNLLKSQSFQYFGVIIPLTASETVTVPRAPGQSPSNLIKLATGLNAQIVTRKAAQNSDMLAFWPNDTNPTHIVTCIEAGNDQIGIYPGVGAQPPN